MRIIPRSKLALIAFIISLRPVEDAAQSHNRPGFTSGTTIVIYKGPNEIVVGADSLLVQRFGTVAVPNSECKIRQVGDAFFAIGGHIREQLTGFDAVKIATANLGNSGKPIDKVKAFEQNILTPLTELLRMVRSKDPAYFEKLLRDKIPVLAVAFFGIEQQSLYLYVRSYKATVYNSTDVKVEFNTNTDCLTGCDRMFALGVNDAIEDFINKNPKYSPASSVELVRKLVQLEIDQRPDYVGPPIDIVRLDTDGVKWVDVKPECKVITSLR